LFVAALALALVVAQEPAPASDPFTFLQPSVTVSGSDRRRLDKGEPVAHALPAKDREVGVFAAVATTADSDRLVAWMQQIEALKKSSLVRQIGRFSDPPTLEDLKGLTLEDDDLADIRKCRRGHCSLKLATAEMDELRRVATEAGPDWKAAVQTAFRRVVLRRVQAFLQGGHAALQAYEDTEQPVQLEPKFSTLLAHSAFLAKSYPRLTEYLERYPHAPLPDGESFMYWSKEAVAGKPNISATQVNIVRRAEDHLPDALVVGKEVFSTHYVNASLSVTAIVRGTGAHNYLVYLNRSEVDVLGRFMGGMVRSFMDRRLKSEAADVLQGLRGRLEGGDPKKPSAEASREGSR
jgi:hypothetical protein